MKLIFGLGNPGAEYEHTRHNAGFLALDALQRLLHAEPFAKKRGAMVSKASGREKMLLIKPQTFMNASGDCVWDFAAYYKVADEDILVIYDDIDLPAGEVRIRQSGGPGTHNGMRDIVAKLGSEDFPRIRCGIGAPEHKGELIGYVLERLSGERLSLLKDTAEQGAMAAKILMEEGIHAAQQEYNRKAKHREEASFKEE